MTEAYSDISGEMTKRTMMADSDLWMNRPPEQGVNEAKVLPVKQRPGRKAARRLRQNTLQGKIQKKGIQHDLSKLKSEQNVFETSNLKTPSQKHPHRRTSRADSKIAALQRGRQVPNSPSPQHGNPSIQTLTTAAPHETQPPTNGGYPSASNNEAKKKGKALTARG